VLSTLHRYTTSVSKSDVFMSLFQSGKRNNWINNWK
jgi:hypothetical protein